MDDAHLGSTSYGYDEVGNLDHFTTPNGVSHTYGYNALNYRHRRSAGWPPAQQEGRYRVTQCLTGMTLWRGQSTVLAQAEYKLADGGQRMGIDEYGAFAPHTTVGQARHTAYVYDALVRLKSETISGDSTHSGQLSYTLDAVGNCRGRRPAGWRLAQ